MKLLRIFLISDNGQQIPRSIFSLKTFLFLFSLIIAKTKHCRISFWQFRSDFFLYFHAPKKTSLSKNVFSWKMFSSIMLLLKLNFLCFILWKRYNNLPNPLKENKSKTEEKLTFTLEFFFWSGYSVYHLVLMTTPITVFSQVSQAADHNMSFRDHHGL